MGYKFKFETLLSYRRNLVELAQQRMAKEQWLLHNHIERLERLRADRVRLIEEFEERKRQKMAASLFAFYIESVNNKEGEILTQVVVVESQRQVFEKSRAELLVRVKDRKIIEKTRERDYKIYLQEELRQEQKEADEMAVLRFGRDIISG
ncbi:MAG: flagellar FliJ family protein [Proteobacteria bacterium]|nr:flagellar FliJ family protein [Pseudomonadota bacterium]MBU1714590.1 flagellar FliJ family protein [Pseudomonadota bacterium]